MYLYCEEGRMIMSTGGLGVIAILGFVGVGLLFVLFVGVIVGILTRNDKKRKMQQKEADPNAHLTQMGVGSGFNTPTGPERFM